VRDYARSRTDKLINHATGHGVLWNRLSEINNCFSKPRRAFLKIVNTLFTWLFPNDECGAIIPKRLIEMTTRVFGFGHSFGLRHSSFVIPSHAPKKKIPVRTALVTSMARRACTTEAVVDCPTPSAPPSTCKPALQATVMTIHAKTALLIMPEYKSQVLALSNARST